jgi:hypothetical protein
MNGNVSGRYSPIRVVIFTAVILLLLFVIYLLASTIFSNNETVDVPINTTPTNNAPLNNQRPDSTPNPINQPSDGIGLRQGTNVTGIYIKQQHFGPPGFGETPSIDENLTVSVLYLSDESKAKLRTRHPQAESLDAIQINLENLDVTLNEGQTYTVVGDSFLAHTGRHFTDVIIEATSVTETRETTQVIRPTQPPVFDEDEKAKICTPTSDSTQLYKNTRPDEEQGVKFELPRSAELTAIPRFRHLASKLVYAEIFDSRGQSLGGRFIKEPEWLCGKDVEVGLTQIEDGVRYAEGEILKQTILLSDIVTDKPNVRFSTFLDEYGHETLMWREQTSSPALITHLDINFDGFNDLGILVDTGPIEDGYVFYFFNDNVGIYEPATLESSPGASFIIYEPTLDIEREVLQGKFTVTSPRRTEFVEYRCDTRCVVEGVPESS